MEITSLDESTAVRSLLALAQMQRLRAFRALVVAGAEGLTPGTLAEQLGVAPSALVHAGLASSEPRGRNLIYRADFTQMNALLAYLTAHCCQGVPCGVADAGCVDC